MPQQEDHKERQRVTKACDNCRKKKIKCDAKGDVCSSCELLQIPCLYLDPTKKRGPPKGAGRYINAIEDRLHRMEAIVGGLVREDDPILQSGPGDELRALFSGSSSGSLQSPRSRGSRDSYIDHHASDTHFQQSQFLQHPHRPALDHQHHPPPLHDYNNMTQQQGQQQYAAQKTQEFVHQQQYPNRGLDMQLNSSQSPDMGSVSIPDGAHHTMDSARTSPLHRDLIRESTMPSFGSPSPILSSEHSVGDLSESTSTPESLPRLGMQTPPVQEVEDLEDDMGHLTLDMRGRERYVGKSSPMFYSRRHYGGQDPSRVQPFVTPEAQKFMENPDLPSPETMTHLLNLHFTYVHPFAPVFVWSKFLKRLQERDYTPSFLFLLNSIFALASRYSDDTSLRKDPAKPETVGARFADKAKEILDTLYDSPDLHCVGALVLLAFQQMGTGCSYRSWMYVGISIRMAQHLGLNRSCTKLNPNMPVLDREERNRIWWTCFMADRIISTSFGRPQGINEHDVDATYPEGIDDEIQLEYKLEGATSMLTGPSPHSEKKFVYMASLMRILGRVMLSLYSPLSKASSLSTSSMTNPAPLEQLDKELTDWLLTLPPHLQFRSVQQEPGTFVCTLHMTFYAVLILLHRPYSHRSSHNTPNDPSISLSICTSAANNTIEMASNMMRAVDESRGVSRLKGLLHNCVFIFFTAGIVHITNCTSTDPVLAASAKLRTIETLKCLSVVEDVWITGKWCGNNIKQLLKARNIELPYSIEGFKSLPLGCVQDMKKKLEANSSSSQMDISMVASIPKEQTFAFDVDQIMGYYNGTGAKHAEPMGRNSRHFSPTPYFSPAAGHHHFSQVQLKTHPGLAQGHSPLPRRPRQGKVTPPSPSGSISVSSSSPATATATTPTSGFFPCLDGTSMGSSTASSQNMNATIDPFAEPGSATLATGGQQDIADSEVSLNMYQNPFSSSLWGLPTSLDNDEWMLYMQNGGANGQTAMDLGVDAPSNQGGINSNTSNGIIAGSRSTDGFNKMEPSMFAPVPDMNSGSNTDQNMNSNGSQSALGSRMHPLAQSLTRNDLMGADDHSGIINTSSTMSALNTSIADASMGSSAAVGTSSAALSSSNLLPVSSAATVVSTIHSGGQHQQPPHLHSTPQSSGYEYYLGGAGGMVVQQQQQQQQQQQ
ncbi:hypothetical protein BGZ68_000074 [Mortierella alpina]|nr:hypothetical protein BGZ68_000074 [Mortierella alpina]